MAKSPQTPLPQLGERALIVGQTGSGKTAFACHLLKHLDFAPIIIYDTKDEPKFTDLPNSTIVTTIAERDKAIEDEKIDFIVFRPPVEITTQPDEMDNLVFDHYNNLREVGAYIDEAYTFPAHSRGLLAMLTRGRSRGITTIISTQRPSRIDRAMISEAQKVYAFKLVDKKDKIRLGDVIPEFAELPDPRRHGFYYYDGEKAPRLYNPVSIAKPLRRAYVDAAPLQSGNDEAPQPETPARRWV